MRSITARRPRIVIEHILEHGYVTTEELRDQYGYDHPPRAARDVREQGVPLETFRVTNSLGRSIGAYRFGNLHDFRTGRLGGRRPLPRQVKSDLMEQQEGKCAICSADFSSRELQVDHAVPYEVGGEPQNPTDQRNYMLLCGSCNRAKSWSCEHCVNWTTERNPEVCRICYWASPSNYSHIALRNVRRLDLIWTGDEVRDHGRLLSLSRRAQEDFPDFVKRALRNYSE